MIYQVRSFNPLCTSKAYCKSKDALHSRIAEIISATNHMRLALEPEEAAAYHWENPVNRMDMESGLEIVVIDEELFPEWEDYLGRESGIVDPVIKIENGVKIYPKRREIPCVSV